MSLYALGLNHQTAPLAVRERVVFHVERLREGVAELTRGLAREAAILSTCNRTELYVAGDEPEAAAQWLARYHRFEPEGLSPYLYTLPREQAVRHACRVAAGLDSMVLGEPQILGQMKEAARAAESAGTLGTLLHKLFQRSFAVAKEVRSTTTLGAASVSMAAAAVRLAARIFPSLKDQNVLFIGAGEMIELCATHFAAQAPARITVANRSAERAERLAHRFNGRAIELRTLAEHLHEYDIVVSSTASSLPILGKGLVERALRARRRRPMFMVDLAVPRDIEPEVAELDDVFLYTVDDLGHMVSTNLDARRSAVAQAEAIIDSQVGQFMHWMRTRENVPLIRALRARADDARLEQFRNSSREHAELSTIAALYDDYRKAEGDAEAARELELGEELKDARASMERLEAELQKALLPKDPNDERNVFLEIRAGTGGDESGLFAGDLFRMYTRYAERQRWQVELISESPSELGGYKEVVVRVVGQGAYSKLKFESGGHRVQRVPATEAQGRIHTSACTVAVLPEADAIDNVVLNPAELRIDTFRASGAGGQHVNKTESAIRVTHLPTGLVVECQDSRSQHKNREKALGVLAARIRDKQMSEQQAKTASTRKLLIGSGDRSQRIRTYNFPQGRVTDHRINLTLYKIERIMDGELDDIVAALQTEYQAEQLSTLAEEAV